MTEYAFTVPPGKRFHLDRFETRFKADIEDKDEASERLEKNLARIDELQERLYAEGAQGLLIVLQAMDTAGKDGTISTSWAPSTRRACG